MRFGHDADAPKRLRAHPVASPWSTHSVHHRAGLLQVSLRRAEHDCVLMPTPGRARLNAHLRDPGGDAEADGMLKPPALPRLMGSSACCAGHSPLGAPSLRTGKMR